MTKTRFGRCERRKRMQNLFPFWLHCRHRGRLLTNQYNLVVIAACDEPFETFQANHTHYVFNARCSRWDMHSRFAFRDSSFGFSSFSFQLNIRIFFRLFFAFHGARTSRLVVLYAMEYVCRHDGSAHFTTGTLSLLAYARAHTRAHKSAQNAKYNIKYLIYIFISLPHLPFVCLSSFSLSPSVSLPVPVESASQAPHSICSLRLAFARPQ